LLNLRGEGEGRGSTKREGKVLWKFLAVRWIEGSLLRRRDGFLERFLEQVRLSGARRNSVERRKILRSFWRISEAAEGPEKPLRFSEITGVSQKVGEFIWTEGRLLRTDRASEKSGEVR
jgi:hypothetical protein